MRTGWSSRSVRSRSLGTTSTHSLWERRTSSTRAVGTSLVSRTREDWAWLRMAPTRTQVPSMGISPPPPSAPRILLASAWDFHSSRVRPSGVAPSIQGMGPAAQRFPRRSVPIRPSARASASRRSSPRREEASAPVPPPGPPSPASRATPPIWATSSPMAAAPAPEAAW